MLKINKTTEWIEKKPISVETAEYIKVLTEKRNNSKNSYEKAMYSRMIEDEKDGVCSRCRRSYNMVDWKSEMEEDKKKFI
jgi:hypothetical protein